MDFFLHTKHHRIERRDSAFANSHKKIPLKQHVPDFPGMFLSPDDVNDVLQKRIRPGGRPARDLL